MATWSSDLGGSSTLLKKVKARILAISTRFEVAPMESFIGLFIRRHEAYEGLEV